MGLDQYVYALPREIAEEIDDQKSLSYFWDMKYNHGRQICYWRKHWALQAWMDSAPSEYVVYWEPGNSIVKLDLTLAERLSLAVLHRVLPRNHKLGYMKSDIEQVSSIIIMLDKGYRLYYESSW